MSHGPLGLGGTFRPAPACWAIVNAAPISVSASASSSTKLILVFIESTSSKECGQPHAARGAGMRALTPQPPEDITTQFERHVGRVDKRPAIRCGGSPLGRWTQPG